MGSNEDREAVFEKKARARAVLVNMARCSPPGLSPMGWVMIVRRTAPHLIETIGEKEFGHLVRYIWRLP